MKSEKTVTISIACRCGYKVESIQIDRMTRSVTCEVCGAVTDFFCRTHTYKRGVCACDELVLLGVAEATRECDEFCGGAKCNTNIQSTSPVNANTQVLTSGSQE